MEQKCGNAGYWRSRDAKDVLAWTIPSPVPSAERGNPMLPSRGLMEAILGE